MEFCVVCNEKSCIIKFNKAETRRYRICLNHGHKERLGNEKLFISKVPQKTNEVATEKSTRELSKTVSAI